MNWTTGFLFVVKSFEVGARDRAAIADLEEEELRRLESLRHPHIASRLGHDILAGWVHIHVEYKPHGSVAELLATFGPVGGALLKRYVRGTVDGLAYLHAQAPPVVHGSIKGANLLVDGAGHVKLTDFGCSLLRGGAVSIGSVKWAAPEVARGAPHDGRQADVWGVGCAVLEMATAEPPWGKQAALDQVVAALRGLRGPAKPPVPHTLSGDSRDFVEGCLAWLPDARPPATELLRHPSLV